MKIKEAVLQAINEVGLMLHIGEADEIAKLVEEKFTSTNIDSSKCLCYSSSESKDGTYYLIRNDCPVHKGALGALRTKRPV